MMDGAPKGDRADKAPDGVAPLSLRFYQNADFYVNYDGPDPAQVDRFVMTFPDMTHPTGPDAPGWANGFLRKRGAAVISLTFEKTNWYQSEGFFPAIEAVRAFVAGRAPISAYGASMGGYGAILAGRRLGADRVVALSPQFSIEPKVAPFDHRYRAAAAEIGSFIHEVSEEISDEISYFVMHDATHELDRKHVDLFPKAARWHSIVQPGGGHGVLETLIQAGGKEALFRLILGAGDHLELRQTVRAGRQNSPRYIRRIGDLCAALPRRKTLAQVMIGEAEKAGMRRLASRWRYRLAERDETAGVARPLEEVLLHIGLPCIGGGGLQAHMAHNRAAYGDQGVEYCSDIALGGGAPPDHRWLSEVLLAGDMGRLRALREGKVQAPRMMLSDEHLFLEMPYIRRVMFKQFRALFSDVPVRVLVCTQDRMAWKRRFYKHALEMAGRPRSRGVAEHWGLGDSFAEFFERPVIAKLSDWDQMFEEARRGFGAEVVEEIALQPRSNGVDEVLGRLGLKAVKAGSETPGNTGLTDVDAEILRQANAQGGTMRGMLRILLGLPPVAEGPVPIKPRLLRKILSAADELDWSALEYRENPPLVFDRGAFEGRKDALRELVALICAQSDVK